MSNINLFLAFGAVLSLVASLMHLLILALGSSGLLFFGAGERMAQMANKGSWYPGFITLIIACILFIFSAYALIGSVYGARDSLYLPFLPWILLLITIIYSLRGISPFIIALFRPEILTPFILWSSIICLVYGFVHIIGLAQSWKLL